MKISFFVGGNFARLEVGDGHLARNRPVLGCLPSLPVGHGSIEAESTGRDLWCKFVDTSINMGSPSESFALVEETLYAQQADTDKKDTDMQNKQIL